MSSLSTLRHSASHILAQAVLKLFPDAKLGIGPAIEEGFYYDFDLNKPLTESDLASLEAIMKMIINEKQSFKHYNLSREDSEKLLKEKQQPYKLEIIRDLNLQEYSFYENGPFVDLCKGPHVETTDAVPAIKLLRVSGAYWKGSEKNKMLQRIYGTAFPTQEALDQYLFQLEEAKKRDHRVLGKELGLFSIEDTLGGGLILWHPKGAMVRYQLEQLWREEHLKNGYQLVFSPHVGRSSLWETSGHLDFYQENMFASMSVEDQDYYLKPMNCPFHILIYQQGIHSYKELPIRYAELGTVYRYERSGVLLGLMRVRGFTQDDAHIICTKEQIQKEILNVLQFCQKILSLFGFSKITTYLSTRPKGKSVGQSKDWEMAESALQKAIDSLNIPYELDEGGGAFYGPKIDIKIQDAIGRQWQCSTIQFDFNLPERFNMTYVNSEGKKERPLMLHRALLGSIERFFGILLEHYAGKFPLWLAPIQVKLLTVTELQSDYAQVIQKQLEEHGIRVSLDSSSEKIGYKIRQGITEKIPYLIVLGKREVEQNNICVRSREEGDLGTQPLDTFLSRLLSEIKEKK